MLKSRWGQSLVAINEAIALEPRRAIHHHLRGEILLKMKKLKQARVSLELATQCEDSKAADFHLLGCICAELRDGVAASQAFEKAMALEPQNEEHQNALLGAPTDAG
jgi:Flp pilus assembly protein TadD